MYSAAREGQNLKLRFCMNLPVLPLHRYHNYAKHGRCCCGSMLLYNTIGLKLAVDFQVMSGTT